MTPATAHESPAESQLDRIDRERSAGRDEARAEAVEKQHARGRLTARAAIASFVDADSLVEYGELARPARPDLDGPADGVITGVLNENMSDTYDPLTKKTTGVWLQQVEESPTATEKLDQIVKSIEAALPPLTNQLAALLANGARAVSNMNTLTVTAQPVATNLAVITAQLREFDGSLGRWLFSAGLNQQLELAATNANTRFYRAVVP